MTDREEAKFAFRVCYLDMYERWHFEYEKERNDKMIEWCDQHRQTSERAFVSGYLMAKEKYNRTLPTPDGRPDLKIVEQVSDD